MRTALLLLLICCSAAATPTAAFAADDEPRTGTYTATFTQRSPHSEYKDFEKRLRKNLRKIEPYDLADESFAVHVPRHYAGKKPFGLIVYIDPGDLGGRMIKAYHKVLNRHNLIWVGANKAGNQREVIHRVGLSLDAIHNMTRQYNIDPNRVYVCGMSGGGRISSWVGMGYPEVVAGTFPFCGVNYFKTIDIPDKPGKKWPAMFPQPGTKLLGKLRNQNRHVLMTGQTDYNRPQTKAVYDAMVEHRFKHVHYMEIPKLGHDWPPPAWFQKGIELLDAPLTKDPNKTDEPGRP